MSLARKTKKNARSSPKVGGVAKAFGKNVKRVRIERDLSQEELADEVKLAVTYLGQIERGLRNPTLNVVEDLAKALKVKLHDLLQ